MPGPSIRRAGLTTKSDRRAAVAIVGGGASGTILAAQLARKGIHAVLIDGGRWMARGVAYATTEPVHLLNVPAEGMSAWADDPDDFARVVERAGGHKRDFAERRFFGSYLDEILGRAVATGHIERLHAHVTGAERDGDRWVINTDAGDVTASALVLANGNQPPQQLANAGERLIANPWGGDARQAIAEVAATGAPVVAIGTGLTMIDLVLSLNSAGYRGRILALSRRGLLPRAHANTEPAKVEEDDLPFGNVRALARWLRRQSAKCGWRSAIDGLRPHSHALWQALSADEQRRFLRHARPWWDVHRHRIAPVVGATLQQLIADGQLEIAAAKIVAVRDGKEAIEIEFRRRGADESSSERFAYAFNCTGPLHAIAQTRDRLLSGLLKDGHVQPDQLGIGLEVDERSRAGDGVWALGPLTKGRYWEIIAIPDIRGQAAAVAADIAQEVGQ